jgi:hypothetical protein
VRVLLDEEQRDALLLVERERRNSVRFSTTIGASPSESSSIASSRGSAMRARPIATICCSPPDVCAAGRSRMLRSAGSRP